jgi:hypothetical protein
MRIAKASVDLQLRQFDAVIKKRLMIALEAKATGKDFVSK